MRQLALFKQIYGLIGWLVVTFIAAAIGATASVNASTFYAQLLQPSWAPPAWLFGPVWSALYLAMGIAAWLVWRTAKFSQTRNAMLLFLVQLALNALWSWVFFMWHEGALAFVNIVVLWCLIVATVIAFFRIQKLAGWLLVPYLVWVSFATALNFAIWQLNPQSLG